MYLIVYALLGVCQSVAIMVYLPFCCSLPLSLSHFVSGRHDSLLGLYLGRSAQAPQQYAAKDHERTHVLL